MRRNVFFGAVAALPLAIFFAAACSSDEDAEAARHKEEVQSRFNAQASELEKIYLGCPSLVTAREACDEGSATRTLRPAATPAEVMKQLEDLIAQFEKVVAAAKKDICSILDGLPSKDQVPKPPQTGTGRGRRPSGDYYIVGQKLSVPGGGMATITFDVENDEAAVFLSKQPIPTLAGEGDFHGWAISTSKASVVDAWSTPLRTEGSRLLLPASDVIDRAAVAFANADDTLVGGANGGALTTNVFGTDFKPEIPAGFAPSDAALDVLQQIYGAINDTAKSSRLGRPIVRFRVLEEKSAANAKYIRFQTPVDTALGILAANPDRAGSVAALQALANDAVAGASTNIAQICKDAKTDAGKGSGSSGGSSGGKGGSSESNAGGGRDSGTGGSSGSERARPDGGSPTDAKLDRLLDLLERLLAAQLDAGTGADGGRARDGGARDGEAEAGEADASVTGDCSGKPDGLWCGDPAVFGPGFMLDCLGGQILLGHPCESCTRGDVQASCPRPPQN